MSLLCTHRSPQARWQTLLASLAVIALSLFVSTARAAPDDEWAEWTYQWGQLSIVVRTDAGVFSPALQALAGNSGSAPKELRPDELMRLTRTFFVMTSAPQEDQTFEFIEPLAKKWGPGHSLPILAAIALENVQRPVPTLFGGPLTVMTTQMKPVSAGGLDPKRPGRLRIVIYGHSNSFRRAAEQMTHASAKAYYDASRNEVGLLLDMDQFRHFYGVEDTMPRHHPATLSAFIAYAMDAFNEDSSHELAHVYQQQTQRPVYAIAAIREGEAEVQGMVRRRDGLVFSFIYSTPDAWTRGTFDTDVIGKRLDVLRDVGRPMHPREVDRLADLKQLRAAGRALRVGDLLAMDSRSFFAGSAGEIDSRYAQAWALCLEAIREKEFAQKLSAAIDARLAGTPRSDLEKDLDGLHARFIDDPYRLVATKEKAWADAEHYYRIDPVFTGVFYAWIHQIDPKDMKALVYLGDALYSGRNLAASMRYYEAAQRLAPLSALPLLRVGDVLSDVGDREQALRTWTAAAQSHGAGQDEIAYRQLALERPRLRSAEAQAAVSVSSSPAALSSTLKGLLGPAAEPWLGFSEYPGARSLCTQRVVGSRGEIIDWRTYAIADDIDRASSFYTGQGLKDPEQLNGGVLFRQGAQGAQRVLTLTPAAAANSPSCDKKPRANEKTVIMVSRMRL